MGISKEWLVRNLKSVSLRTNLMQNKIAMLDIDLLKLSGEGIVYVFFTEPDNKPFLGLEFETQGSDDVSINIVLDEKVLEDIVSTGRLNSTHV